MILKNKAKKLVYEMITKMVLMWNRGVPIKIKPKAYVPEKPTMTKDRRRAIYERRVPILAETSGLNIADPDYEDAVRSRRFGEMWGTAQRTPAPRVGVPFGRNLIKGYFKITGLYK